MEKILIGVAGIVLLVSLAVAGSILWLNHKAKGIAQDSPGKDLDFRDPKVAASFRQQFYDSCVANSQKKTAQDGKTPTSDEISRVQSTCNCVADQVIAGLAKKSQVTFFDVVATLAGNEEVFGVNGCLAKLP